MHRGFWTRLAGVRLLVLWYNTPAPIHSSSEVHPEACRARGQEASSQVAVGSGTRAFSSPSRPILSGIWAVMPLSSLFAYVGPFQLQQRLG